MKFVISMLSPVFALFLYTSSLAFADEASDPQEVMFAVRPIGRIEMTEGRTRIVLNEIYQPGLLGLGGFSHIHVFWWFDKNDSPEKRATLQVHPRGNPENPLTGVFATRSPVRPNLIALTLCKVISIKENTVEVDKIDAFPGTPVLDIKPFIPRSDSATNAKVPEWAK